MPTAMTMTSKRKIPSLSAESLLEDNAPLLMRRYFVDTTVPIVTRKSTTMEATSVKSCISRLRT